MVVANEITLASLMVVVNENNIGITDGGGETTLASLMVVAKRNSIGDCFKSVGD